MKLLLEIRETASARQLAQLHAYLSEAKRLITAAATMRSGAVNPLRSTSQDRLIYLARAIAGAIYSIEKPFLARAGADAPLAAPTDPSLWQRWLDEHHGEVRT